MDEAEGGRGGDRGTELPGRPTTGHSKPAKRGGVLGVALPVFVSIYGLITASKTSVGPGQTVGYQFSSFNIQSEEAYSYQGKTNVGVK